MMINGFEIYIDDLKDNVREELEEYLEDVSIYDITPIAILYKNTSDEE